MHGFAYIEALLLFLMTASQRYAMHGMRKSSKYLIDIGEGNTMHIVTLPALLSSWHVTISRCYLPRVTLSKDLVARITAKMAKKQSKHIGGTIARGLVEGNGIDIVVSGQLDCNCM